MKIYLILAHNDNANDTRKVTTAFRAFRAKTHADKICKQLQKEGEQCDSYTVKSITLED